MSQRPTVRVGSFWKQSKGRFYLKWRDPVSGKVKTRQTEITNRNRRGEKQAATLASQLEEELQRRRRSECESMSWRKFQELYRSERLVHTSAENRNKFLAAARYLSEEVADHGMLFLEEISPMLLLRVENRMRKRLSPASVRSYSATLRAGLQWAARMGLMHSLPHRPPETVESELPVMRLQMITGEHLDRILAVVPKVVGNRHAPGIADYIRGLWLGGCRLREPSLMHATRLDYHHPITLEGDRPVMAWVSRQKNRRDQFAPVTLDFAAFLLPRCEGRDWMFQPTSEHGRIETKHELSAVISAIGKASGVIAEPGPDGGGKTVTAKHFRSSFVTRWSSRGMPLSHIQRIVRHSSEATTRKYYLAPANEKLVAEFRERDWMDWKLPSGDQNGDHVVSEALKNP